MLLINEHWNNLIVRQYSEESSELLKKKYSILTTKEKMPFHYFCDSLKSTRYPTFNDQIQGT